MPLPRTAALYDSAARGAGMIGAAVGGVLMALLGAEKVLLPDAATFAVSAALLAAGLRLGPRPGLECGVAAGARARKLGGAADLGLLEALFSAGALVGALVYGLVGNRVRRWPVFTVAFSLWARPASWWPPSPAR